MGTPINLDDELIREARAQAKVMYRSVPKQIEYWAKIGHIAEDNPDLTYSQIKDILLGLQDAEDGDVSEYKRGML